MNQIQLLMAEARRALGGHQHIPAGYDSPTAFTRRAAASVGTVSLTELPKQLTPDEAVTIAQRNLYVEQFRLNSLLKDGTAEPAVLGRAAQRLDEVQRSLKGVLQHASVAAVQSLSTQVIAASRVAQAGAQLVFIKDAPEPVQNDSGILAFYSRPHALEVVTPALFTLVLDGADITATAVPVVGAQIDFQNSPAYAVKMAISRREQTQKTEELQEAEIMAALTMGLARLADLVLLQALPAVSPSAFSLAKAAAHGLKFNELRAVVGSLGTGAAVGVDGVLRASGIPAELTDTVTASYIGNWARAGVAFNDEVRLVVDRVNTRGDLSITAYANVQGVVADAGAFWTAP